VRHQAQARFDLFLDGNDSIFIRFALGNVLHAKHATAVLGLDFHHLLQAGDVGGDQIVRKMNHEGRIAHHRARAQNGVTQSERRRLTDINA